MLVAHLVLIKRFPNCSGLDALNLTLTPRSYMSLIPNVLNRLPRINSWVWVKVVLRKVWLNLRKGNLILNALKLVLLERLLTPVV